MLQIYRWNLSQNGALYDSPSTIGKRLGNQKKNSDSYYSGIERIFDDMNNYSKVVDFMKKYLKYEKLLCH